ncbi:MAG TPA: septum formation protein Maf [Ghiorsea sp.]|nr:septum formation protein Maf [Ghiorsea sp.]HIP06763.1 septum formation protein Maf [Mariprofundaceae bacterium]
MNIILASQSPRRLFLLEAAGIDVVVHPSFIDETPLADESALSTTQRLCKEKASACQVIGKATPIIAADTLVAIGNEALGQPQDLAEAKQMIQKLSGKQHQVHTTVCVRLGDVYQVETVTTTVSFRAIASAEIDVYVQHNDILDKAGAYAIQGGASGFITGIEGSLDNVIGLPVATTLALIAEVQQEVQALQEV